MWTVDSPSKVVEELKGESESIFVWKESLASTAAAATPFAPFHRPPPTYRPRPPLFPGNVYFKNRPFNNCVNLLFSISSFIQYVPLKRL